MRTLHSLTLALLLGACQPPTAEDDAGLSPGADAGVNAADARPGSPDAQTRFDAGGYCSVNGVAGECIDTTKCTGTRAPVPGHCPGAANIQCCVPLSVPTTDGGGLPGMCDPTLHPLPNEGLTEEPGEGGCPAGMLRISDATHNFCIDRFEATLVAVNADGTTRGWSPYFNPGSTRVRALSLRSAVPQGYINGLQAGQACHEAGKRLCTDTEWQRACRGPDNLVYPYGNTRETGVCNDHRAEHPAVELFGSVTNLSSPCINQLHDTVDRSGSRTGCVTEDGVFDMMGNEHEWTADPNGTFRGGFYVDTVINGNGCLYVTTAHNTAYSDYSTGFRCCAD